MLSHRRTLVLALAVLGPVLLAGTACGPGGRAVEVAAPGHRWNQTHRVDRLPGWRVSARNVGATDESTSLEGPAGRGCLVSLSVSGPATDARPQSPHPVTVQGHAASYGPLDRNFGPYPHAVLWQEADQQWVQVSCDLEEADVLRVAGRVRFEPHPMHLPFRLSALPEGFTLVQLIESADGRQHTGAAQLEGTVSARRLSMEVSNVADPTVIDPTVPVERATIAGRLVLVRRASQAICLPLQPQPVCVFGPGDEPASDWSPAARLLAEQTVAALTPVADVTDTDQWFDADEAVPR